MVSARSAPPVFAGRGTPGNRARTLWRWVESVPLTQSLPCERYAWSGANTPQRRSPASHRTRADRSTHAVPPRPSRRTTQKRTGSGGAVSGAVHSTQVVADWPVAVVSVERREEMLPAVAKKLNPYFFAGSSLGG